MLLLPPSSQLTRAEKVQAASKAKLARATAALQAAHEAVSEAHEEHEEAQQSVQWLREWALNGNGEGVPSWLPHESFDEIDEDDTPVSDFMEEDTGG
eukprot:12792143-Prorocentrum_lima.AAC.1